MGFASRGRWWAAGFGAVGLWALALEPAMAQDCAAPIAEFTELAARLGEPDLAQEATVLNAELLTRDGLPCEAFWLVELLPPGGDVVVVALDARTLDIWPGNPEMLLDTLEQAEQDDDEPRPLAMTLLGTPGSDFLEGSWTDDVSTGGTGRDIFFVTPGRDVITDFRPGEDILEFTDFARREEGFGTLPSLEAVRRAARMEEVNGQDALVIDLDGQAGGWSLTLPGVRSTDLDRGSVSFDDDDPSRDEVDNDFLATRQVTASDGTVVLFPGHIVDDPPEAPVLLRGEEETLELLFELFGYDDDFDESEDD